jgi:hypothetical protein
VAGTTPAEAGQQAPATRTGIFSCTVAILTAAHSIARGLAFAIFVGSPLRRTG